MAMTIDSILHLSECLGSKTVVTAYVGERMWSKGSTPPLQARVQTCRTPREISMAVYLETGS